MAKATLYLGTLTCKATSPESNSDDVFVRVYVDDVMQHRWPANNATVDFDKNDNANTDIALNVEYATSVRIEVWDRDSSGNDDSGKNDKLGVYYLDRRSAPSGTLTDYSTNTQARYELKYRLITNRIPTVRILGIRCEKESAGMNVDVAEAVFGALEDCADAAAKVIGTSPRPRAKAISKGFKAASDVLAGVEKFIKWFGEALEGLDDVYMVHLAGSQGSHDIDGRFFPKQTEPQTCKMKEGDEVFFEEKYGEYFRFPVDQEDVTIEFREKDPTNSINIGALTIKKVTSDSDSRLDGPAVVEVANTYGKRGGEGAVYHMCYSIGMEDWALAASTGAQGGGGPSEWTPVGNTTVIAEPALSALEPGNLRAFGRGPQGDVLITQYLDYQWGTWRSLGGGIEGAPAAAAWSKSRHDVVVRGVSNNLLWHSYYDASVGPDWSGWRSVTTTSITSSPALVSWGAGRLDCFVRGPAGSLFHLPFQNGKWAGEWHDLGGEIQGAPAAACWGPNRIDVVVRNMRDGLSHRAWDGQRWTDWIDLGEGGLVLTDSPVLCALAPGCLECFTRASATSVARRVFADGVWGDWTDLGGGILGAPAAVACGGRIDILGQGTDAKLWTMMID